MIRRNDWFQTLMGFKEKGIKQVQNNITIHENTLTSKVNQQTYQFGKLEIKTLQELRKSIQLDQYNASISIGEIVGDVRAIHTDEAYKGSLFQVASQFNLLEMVSPNVTPEDGIGIYEKDRTQGPACAIACGAGTIYRNYFVPLHQQIGQSKDLQVNCLSEMETYFDNSNKQLWKMENGYCFPTADGLEHITKHIQDLDDTNYSTLQGLLRVGIQWDSQVTISDEFQTVSQVYASALPVAYSSSIQMFYWESFARLILEATYEATLYTGLLNYERSKNPNVFLTFIGGGAFGNNPSWIFESIIKALTKFKNTPLNITFISFNEKSKTVSDIIQAFN